MLSERGHVAEHVTDIGPRDAPDRELWRYALEHDAVLVTKDEDFSDMLLLGGSSPVLVWVRVGNTRRRALLEWFEPLIDRIVALVDAGNRLRTSSYSPRRQQSTTGTVGSSACRSERSELRTVA